MVVGLCVCVLYRYFGTVIWSLDLARSFAILSGGLLLPLSTTVVDCVFEGRRLSQSFMCVPLGICVCVCRCKNPTGKEDAGTLFGEKILCLPQKLE